jgi:tRNA wybutosine-synthesizing protein 2
MFSRGNIREKARLLAFHSPFHSPPLPRHSKPDPAAYAAGKWAVDLYAGIGYFAFCYARLGLRVLCWEMNPWSVEGLRRGARGNGFGVRVVRPPSLSLSSSSGLSGEGGGVVGGGEVDLEAVLAGGEQIVVFLEDNRFAAGRVRRLRELRERAGEGLPVVHVNCGLLPRSDMVWRDAWDMVDGREGWLHLHENVGEGDIESRRGEVQGLFDKWKAEGKEAEVDHVERVKTFAPGVWHCVFDVFITRPGGGG